MNTKRFQREESTQTEACWENPMSTPVRLLLPRASRLHPSNIPSGTAWEMTRTAARIRRPTVRSTFTSAARFSRMLPGHSASQSTARARISLRLRRRSARPSLQHMHLHPSRPSTFLRRRSWKSALDTYRGTIHSTTKPKAMAPRSPLRRSSNNACRTASAHFSPPIKAGMSQDTMRDGS